MEILFLFLIIAGAAVYIWYRMPSTQLMRAMSFLKAQKMDEAIIIFEMIFDQHPNAPVKLAECNYMQGIEYLSYDREIAKSFFNQAIGIKYRLPAKANKKDFEKIEAKAYLEICKINFDFIASEKSSKNKLNLILDNIQYIDDITTRQGVEHEFFDLKQKYIFELTELYYLLGVNSEKIFDITNAIQLYYKAVDMATVASNDTIKANAIARIGICKLKNGEAIDESLLYNIDDAAENLKTDFYFRYVKNLIRKNKYQEAEILIQKYLNIDFPVIEKLKAIAHSTKTEEIVSKINFINHTLDKLYENAFPIEELKVFYENLNQQIDSIESTDLTIAEKLKELKLTLFYQLLTSHIEVERFAGAINLIQNYPFFWKNPELMKNLSICCYGFISQGNLNQENYKTIISYYLTAVYSDKIILKSIEQINWCDNYTFTLIEAIGSINKYHGTLPDNVNYDEVSDANISIGATQKELLNQFEMLLQKIDNPLLSNNAQDFYSSEKISIERAIDIIDKDILFASPFFAKVFNLNKTLIMELDDIYAKYSREEALDAAIPYLDHSNTNTCIQEYALAKELLPRIEKTVQEENLNELRSINSDQNKWLIQKYNSINSKIEDLLFNSIASKIDDINISEHLILIMEEAIRFSDKNEKLKYLYSNYITNCCITNLNTGKINNLEALLEMKNAYLYSPNNLKICNSVITLIKLNLIDIINGQTNREIDIYTILDEIYPERSTTFMQETAELIKAREQILQVLINAGIDISLLEDTLSFPGRQRLNKQGEKMKTVLFYLKKMTEQL
jgi:hypothetical protein